MSIFARSYATTSAESLITGRRSAEALLDGSGEAPKLVVVHLTVHHDARSFLTGVRDVLGPSCQIIGCSTQGVIGRRFAVEDGFAAGLMALGGSSIEISDAMIEDTSVDTVTKARVLGRELRQKLSSPPVAAIVFYDPLAGLNVEPLLEGIASEIDAPIIGGAAGHAFSYEGPMSETYQYHGGRVLSHAAVAFAVAGNIRTGFGICHGCSPFGIEMTVTRAEGNTLLELDGRNAGDVWGEFAGSNQAGVNLVASLAIGVPAPDFPSEYLVRAVFSLSPDGRGVTLSSAIPTGTRVMLHHRTVQDVLDGAQRMAADVRTQLAGHTLRAAFCFECGARTKPFLGLEDTLNENLMIQRELGPDAAWGGGMFWGELYPVGRRAAFHNYSYPLFAIAE